MSEELKATKNPKTFEEWFFSDDPMVDRIGNSPDPMWQIEQAYNAGLTQAKTIDPDNIIDRGKKGN
jgi:hypothetical protein